jgi:hypothetical protein
MPTHFHFKNNPGVMRVGIINGKFTLNNFNFLKLKT